MEPEREVERRWPTLPVGRVSVVEGLLALAYGSREGQVCLHHPLLAAVHHRLGCVGHGHRVALGHVLGERGQRLLGLAQTHRGGGSDT